MIGGLRLEPEASAELEDAAAWDESQEPGLGMEFLQTVEASLERIIQWPHLGRRVPGMPDDIPSYRVPLNRFPYHIVYLDWDSVIRIVALAHDRREPGSWLSRIRSIT